jgi:hypothetical protein
MENFWNGFYKEAEVENLGRRTPKVEERSFTTVGPRLAEITEKADSNEFPQFRE